MKKISLTPRLKAVADLITERKIADVGCDHGKLILYLYQNNLIDCAILSDLSEKSLKKAENLLKNDNQLFEFRTGDGLQCYSEQDNLKQIVIAGMGGLEICKIIEESPILIGELILQPQRDNFLLKKFLIDKGYNIAYDKIVKEKSKFYNIIKAKYEKMETMPLLYMYVGKDNFYNDNEDFKEFLLIRKNKLENIKKIKSENIKFHEIQNELKYINKAIKKLQEKINE